MHNLFDIVIAGLVNETFNYSTSEMREKKGMHRLNQRQTQALRHIEFR